MLYVFHVDAGQMTTYDMNLTLQSVDSLKAAIEKKIKIPASSLVLLVSGGEVLQSDHMVSSYSAGTDTNPIYMFSKPSVKESHIQQSMCDLSPIVELSSGEFRSDSRSALDGKSVVELRAAVEKCCMLPRNMDTVIICANLAKEFSDLAHEVYCACDQLVHEQHLQHQGWAAVVANLEDILKEFAERSKCFKESLKQHKDEKNNYQEQLEKLNEVLESLGKIPILYPLQINAKAHRFSAFDVFEETDFEGHYYGVDQPLDSSFENRAADFGVGVFKLSEENVFDQKNLPSTSNEGENLSENRAVDESDVAVTFKASPCDSKDDPTLLHWILAQGNKASLQDIIDYCQKGLALIDAEPLKDREAELCRILEYANMHGLKQIKGIEGRLYGLNQLLNDVKKTERDQHNQAASLIQSRERLNTVCDASVLPTLVESHWRQLEKLLSGHQVLVDIRRRIAKSKEELSHILKARLEAVLMIENSMSVQDAHAMLSFQCFNRLARYFGIVGQLHRAPRVYVRAVHEVARRRTFSHSHLKWATDLAQKLYVIHEEEVTRRQEFNCDFDDHFLKSLFPGMTDLPPSFATQAPYPFDSKLPQISSNDVEMVTNAFPDLVVDMPKYDMDGIVKFFQQRLSASELYDRDVHVQVDFEKDFESKTGFEKMSDQSELKQTAESSTTTAVTTVTAATLTEVRLPPAPEFLHPEFYIEESLPSSLDWGRGQENSDNYRRSIEQLEDFLVKLFNLCKISVVLIRDELVKLTKECTEQKEFISNMCSSINEEWQKYTNEINMKFREDIQRLTVDQELELSDMKAALTDKDNSISDLKRKTRDLKLSHLKEIEKAEDDHTFTKDLLEKTREDLHSFEKKFEEMDALKQKEVKEMQEKLHLEYKAEIESLRSRFRLVALTNMDRSPSESSLEKIERTDVIEISNHNAIVMQTKENAEIEKEEAVKEAVEKCTAEWEQKLNAELMLSKSKYEAEKQVTINDVTRRLLAEKDRQLELVREREQVLARECGKYRDTIHQLTDPDTNDYDALLKTRFSIMEGEKAALQQQLNELKKELEKKNEEADKSREDESDGRSSPRSPRRRRCHTPVGLVGGALSLSACLPEHAVLLLWDPAHLNYTVMQESSIMYFVHSDCLPALDLSIHVKNESERRLYAVATVESKEYCYAKKNGNRFLMPRGSRFYRVRVKPYKPQLPHPACCDRPLKQDAMRSSVLPVLSKRPLMKWLTYMHVPDVQKSIDTSQSTSSNTDEASRVEVATATLINLESPVSSSEALQAEPPSLPITSGLEGSSISGLGPSGLEDQLDSIESTDQWHTARMHLSSISTTTDMECSVGRCVGGGPPEMTVSSQAVEARGCAPPGSELAEEAAP